MTDSEKRIVATVSASKRRRYLIAPALLATVGILVALGTEYICRVFVGVLTPSEELGIRICMQGLCSLLSLGAALEMAIPCLQRELVTCDGRLFMWLKRRPLESVALDNITAVQVRESGTVWGFGTDRGVGLVLERPEFRGLIGTARLTPRLNWLISKYHTRIPPIYQDSTERIATLIADAAAAVRGQPVPVHIFTPSGSSIPIARALGAEVPPGVACLQCGYDLRSQPRSGKCPECGQPVEPSMEAQVTWIPDLQWLSGLRWGSGMLAVSGLLTIFVSFLFRELAFASIQGGPTAVLAKGMILPPLLGIYFFLLLGAMLFTRQPGLPQDIAADPWTRRAARWSLTFAALLVVSSSGRFWTPWAMLVSIWFGCLLAGLLLWYSRRILERLGRYKWRVLATFGAVFFLETALGPVVIEVVEATYDWLVPVRSSPPASPPRSAPTQSQSRSIATLIMLLAVIMPAMWTAVFTVIWFALRSKAQFLSRIR